MRRRWVTLEPGRLSRTSTSAVVTVRLTSVVAEAFRYRRPSTVTTLCARRSTK
jgi:hypothetical protein